MKKITFLSSLLISLLLMSSVVHSAETSALGDNNFTVKVDYISFFDKNNDDSFYVGFEGYKELAGNVYVGVEAGYVSTDGNLETFEADPNLDSDLIFIPIELNVKYTIKATSKLIIDLGTGISCSYAKEDVPKSYTSDTIDDWVLGGQLFADLNYKIGQLFIGFNGKVQLTDKGKDSANNYSNWRIGGQIGVMF